MNVRADKTTRRGEPAVVFSSADMARAAAPFTLALIGKFSRGRPAMEEIQKFFNTLDLMALSVGLLDLGVFHESSRSRADRERLEYELDSSSSISSSSRARAN